MKTYKCHKVVKAAKIVGWNGSRASNGELTGSWFDIECDDGQTYRIEGLRGAMPEAGRYLVEYEDGYRSVSPAKAFEDGYTLVD